MIVSSKDDLAVIRAKAERVKRQRKAVEVEPDKPLSLKEFVRVAWHVLEPDTRFIDGWHIDAICEHLEAVTRGDIKRLIINVPPGSMKSMLTCVMWPAWEWGEKRAHTKWLFGSYAEKLAYRDSTKMRRLIRSGWYQKRYSKKFHILFGQDTKGRYDNNLGGYRIATSVGGTGTGERADCVVIDDPQKKIEIHTSKRERANDWIKTELRTRGTSPDFKIVLIQQRLHESDSTGFLLSEMSDFTHLVIPARYEPERSKKTEIGWTDPRTEDNEIYWTMYNEESLSKLEGDLGPSEASGQLQQRPYPAGGQIVKEVDWNFWCPHDVDLPPIVLRDSENNPIEKVARKIDVRSVAEQAQSWDMTFKDTKSSAYVVGQVWGIIPSQPANRFLMDQVRSKADIVKSIRMVADLTNRNPMATKKWIEEKANGAAVLRMLRDKIPGLKPVNPEGSKESRLHACHPLIEAGNVYLPHPSIAPWVWEFISEFKAFPNGRYKDQVDSATQALIELMNTSNAGGGIDGDALLSGLLQTE